MRLTEKTSNGFAPKYEMETKTNYYDLVSKLGKLEDVEGKLGIDLVTLFKALKEGAYFKEGSPSSFIVFDSKPFLRTDKGLAYLDYPYSQSIHYLIDYKKTWALTKEELE